MLPEGLRAETVKAFFQELFETTSLPVNEIARRTENIFQLDAGMGLTTFQNLLLQRQIQTVDLSKPLDLVSTRIGAEKGGLSSWIEIYA